MKYKSNIYLLLRFSPVGTKKKTKTFVNFLTTKDASDQYLEKHPDCSTVIARVLYNSEDVNDKWEYKK